MGRVEVSGEWGGGIVERKRVRGRGQGTHAPRTFLRMA